MQTLTDVAQRLLVTVTVAEQEAQQETVAKYSGAKQPPILFVIFVLKL